MQLKNNNIVRWSLILIDEKGIPQYCLLNKKPI